ncbi:hypothetical protein M3P19_04050 [Muricauda sp. 2012CJ35-5]|uniref:Peptidase M61 catalytic domain-containing protein n=1 Tax=Flagellimonas spongiicola TaxID=2942208 RepID=A0ABT0PPG7_9FLAO|nr:hypothetical protein [Allomuricauda spongiicola]MCL6273166.1 hypothetical protein [Allomuricauda spongiicola]
MKITLSTIANTLLCGMLFACFTYGTKPNRTIAENPKNVSYNITLHEKQPDILKIEGNLKMNGTRLYMANGAQQLPRRWANFIKNLSATDDKGRDLSITEHEDGGWTVNDGHNKRITLNYEYHLDHMEHEWSGGLDGVAYSTDWGNFYAGRTLFIYNNLDETNIELKFNIPNVMKLTHPWEPKKENPKILEANTMLDVTLSMFFIGQQEETKIQKDGFELRFALGGNGVISEKAEYLKMANGVMDYYIQLMGGIPNPPPGSTLKSCVVVINEAEKTDGEVLGNNISIMVQKDADPMSKMLSKFIFAHEFFHLWNGKSFIPENERLEWFKEGFTNYYTLKSLRQIGFMDDQAFLDVLNQLFYQRYINDDGLGTIAMVQGDQKHGHWGLIYAGGMFAAIAQDMIIRKHTGNSKNLDYLMRGLYRDFAGTNELYSMEDIRSRLTALSGLDQTSFFETYIEGMATLPIDEYLSLAPFEASISNKSLQIMFRENLTQDESEMLEGFFGKSDF